MKFIPNLNAFKNNQPTEPYVFSPKVWTHIFLMSLLLAFSLDTLNIVTEEKYLFLNMSPSEKPQK